MLAKIDAESPAVTRYYFDHNATGPVHPEVAEVFASAMRETFGNASSVHREGQAARQRIERAREQVAAFLGCSVKEVVFTSGGTESDNLAIFGVARRTAERRHVITTAIEHPAVLNTCAQLEREGVEVTYVQPLRSGVVDPEAVRRQLRPHTVLVSVMHANNETGVMQPVNEIGAIARNAGILFHSDGVQAAGKVPLRLADAPIDLYSISGHKFGAPKGVGALFVRSGVELQPTQFGGKHERSRRAGTENVPGIIALGAACTVPHEQDVSALRDRLEQGILSRVRDATVSGAGADRLPNTSNIRFDGIEGEAVVISLDLKGFAVSSGSACSSGAVEPSHVLLAMGLTPEQAKSSVRFSLGPGNTVEQVDRLVEAVEQSVTHLRRISPVYA
ncbi:MAG: cysteine desulfurase family protein [Bryobacteraceae bacterium]